MKPRTFWAHVYCLSEPKGRVWAISTQGRYLIATALDIQVPVETVFRGPAARQPKAYLKGKGVVRKHRDGRISVQAA